MKRLFDRAKDKALAAERARALLPKIDAWHRWFYANRDPHGEGLVAILHPWESGRDNSIDWDEAFERVPTDGIDPYTRRDTQHADPAHRPTKEQYDRYLWLVQHFRDARLGQQQAPRRLAVPGHRSGLQRHPDPLLRRSRRRSPMSSARWRSPSANRAPRRGRPRRAGDALERRARPVSLQGPHHRRADRQRLDRRHPAGLRRGPEGARRRRSPAPSSARRRTSRFIVPSHDPADPRFEAKRYWRGPAWLVMNYMIADGLRREGETAVADHIVRSSLELITQSGFAEYYDPLTGEPCGGGRFTWTAAMVIEFLEAARMKRPRHRGPPRRPRNLHGRHASRRSRRRATSVIMAIATDGAKGGTIDPAELVRMRSAEAKAGAALFGVTPRHARLSRRRASRRCAGDRPHRGARSATSGRQLVITHAPNDYHGDHRALSDAVRIAANFVAPVMWMETIMGVGFAPTHYIDITPHFATEVRGDPQAQVAGPGALRRDGRRSAAAIARRSATRPEGYAEAFRFEPIFPFADIRNLLPPAPGLSRVRDRAAAA